MVHAFLFIRNAPTSRAPFVAITRTCGGVLHKERIKRQATALSKAKSYTPGAPYAGAHEGKKGDGTWICQISVRPRVATHHFCGVDNHKPTAHTGTQRPPWPGPRSRAIARARALRGDGARVAAARRVARLAVLAEEAVERLLLADRELAGLDARVVHAQQRVDVIHRLRAHVRELLDLRRRVLDLCGACVDQPLLLTSGVGSGRWDVPRRR